MFPGHGFPALLGELECLRASQGFQRCFGQTLLFDEVVELGFDWSSALPHNDRTGVIEVDLPGWQGLLRSSGGRRRGRPGRHARHRSEATTSARAVRGGGVMAAGGCAGWVVDAWLGVGAGGADLAFESVGVTEPQAQDVAEVGDEPVAGPAGHQPVPHRVKGGQGGRLQPEMIKSTSVEHGGWPSRLVVPDDLEDVELRRRTHPQQGEADAVSCTVPSTVAPNIFW